MKKLLIAVLALTLSCAVFCGCDKGEAVKVLKEVELTSEEYAFAISKSNSDDLVSVANDLLAEIKGSGKLDEIINSFFDGTSTFTYENPASESGCFIVATNAYFPPFEYYVGNKFSGVDIEIASLLAKKVEKTLFVKNMEFDSIIGSIMNGSCDIGMAGMTITEERLNQVNFTNGYYESAQVLVVKGSNTEFDACTTAAEIEEILSAKGSSYTIGTQKGTTGYMYSAGDVDFGYDGFTNLKTSAYTTGALAIKDLSNGKIDAVIIDKQPALMISESINAKF